MKSSDQELQDLGKSLREIDPSALQTDADDGSLRWFQGERGVELFAWARPDGVDHAQLVIRDRTVEWSRHRGLSTAELSVGGASLGGRYDPYLVRAAGIDAELCRAALVLLEASPLAQEAAAPFVVALRAQVGTGGARAP
jgi:hypothetical protein